MLPLELSLLSCLAPRCSVWCLACVSVPLIPFQQKRHSGTCALSNSRYAPCLALYLLCTRREAPRPFVNSVAMRHVASPLLPGPSDTFHAVFCVTSSKRRAACLPARRSHWPVLKATNSSYHFAFIQTNSGYSRGENRDQK